MNKLIQEIILKKNSNQALTQEEIDLVVKLIHEKKLSDEMIGKFLKSIQKNQFNDAETIFFFDSIYQRSQKIEVKKNASLTLDKHSTGGIGDKTTLVLMPLLAYFGVKTYKLSGVRLGYTGGTIDKLFSFPKIKLNYSREEIFKETTKNDSLICHTMSDVCEIEKKLYHLRTKTNTTKSVDLIVNSILIKKILFQNDILVLDVKVGKGSLFQNTKDIERFVHLTEIICKKYKRKCIIIYSNMNQPLGKAVGNKIEVFESMDVLAGKGPSDVVELVTELCAHSLLQIKKFKNLVETKAKIKKVIASGKVMPFFKALIENQGGEWDALFLNRKLKVKHKITLKSSKKGYFYFKNAEKIGHFLNEISLNNKNVLDFDAGIYFLKKNNDPVAKGEDLFIFYTNKNDIQKLKTKTQNFFEIIEQPKSSEPLIFKKIS